MAVEIQHKDVLGNPILSTSKLAVAYKNNLYVCSILKITPKMMRVKSLKASYQKEMIVYPGNTVVVDGPDVLAYMLKGS
jgi:hypothetical protein